jgi:hypothetical protein
MITIPRLVGFEYKKVQALTDDQKSLVVEALGYTLADSGIKALKKRRKLLETFVAFVDRGEIL